MPPKNSSRRLTLSQALNQAAECLRLASIDSALLDAELLLAHILKKPRSFVIAHGEQLLTDRQYSAYHLLITHRARHYPLAYLTGTREFYGLEFLVTEATLVPRPESELLVEEALPLITKDATLIDLGTGSGCLIISVLKNTRQKPARAYAVDISPKALAVARANARRHMVMKYVRFLAGDLMAPIPRTKQERLVILANLPYLTAKETTSEPSIRREPRSALYGGRDGLSLYRRLRDQLKERNLPAAILCEINPHQKAAFKKIWNTADITFKKDLSGKTRLGIVNFRP